MSNFSRFNPHTWQNIFLLLLIPHFSCFSTEQVHSRLLILVQLFVFLVRESRFTCRKTVVVDTHKMGEKKKKTIHLYTENVCMYNNNNNNNTRIEEEEVEGVEAAGEAPKVC